MKRRFILIIIIFIIFFIFSNQTKNEKIPVVYCLDSSYFYPTYVSIYSLLKNKNKETFYHIFFLMPSNIKESNISTLLSELEKIYSNTLIEIIYINERQHLNDFLDKKYLNHINIVALYRLLLPELISQYDKLIYLDGDTLVLQDLTEMFDIELNNTLFMGQIITKSRIYDIKRFEKAKEQNVTIEGMEEFKKNENHINSGVLLMNLKLLREQGTTKKMIDCGIKYWDYLNNYDQTLINLVGGNQTKILPAKYGLFPKTFEDYKNRIKSSEYMRENEESYLEAYSNPGIIHFANKKKPWFLKEVCFRDLWWKYAAETGFSQEIKDKFSKFSDQQEFKKKKENDTHKIDL